MGYARGFRDSVQKKLSNEKFAQTPSPTCWSASARSWPTPRPKSRPWSKL
ncbi:MAG: hypothetical protein WKG07_33765 [Hymenobacter sp.]